MFKISAFDSQIQPTVQAVAASREQVPGGGFLYREGVIPPFRTYEGEQEDTKKILDIEKFGLDKHYKKHIGTPPPLELPKTISEQVAKRLIIRNSIDYYLTVEVDASVTRISFQELVEEE